MLFCSFIQVLISSIVLLFLGLRIIANMPNLLPNICFPLLYPIVARTKNILILLATFYTLLTSALDTSLLPALLYLLPYMICSATRFF